MESTKQTEKARQEAREMAEQMELMQLFNVVVHNKTRNGVLEKVLEERVFNLSELETGLNTSAKSKKGEGYPPNWKHCTIHLNPETGEMHSGGDHSVRDWIEKRMSDLQSAYDKLVEMVDGADRIVVTPKGSLTTGSEYCLQRMKAGVSHAVVEIEGDTREEMEKNDE